MSSAASGDVAEAGTAPGAALGQRLRQARLTEKISIREMGRRVGVSPSFISQVELGRAAPSIGTLYAITSELNLSLDSLMASGNDGDGPSPEPESPVVEADEVASLADVSTDARPLPGHQSAADRPSIQLGDVTWERLTAEDDPEVEFLRITYPPGSESCSQDNLMHHNGWEYGHVLSGTLDVQVSFRTVSLAAGDSIDFDSSSPHRLSNPHAEPCVAIWVVVGRQQRRG
ncbi:cupin domain-containing protein [Prauserella cavernicola]|uniref:cupin domain-containing protein n=1 Tax=Prauserella cavernicola TaxID=2800127 RepID=UPI0027DE32D6|nr:cupin domain-containing protein [Prauserella cavernicola]